MANITLSLAFQIKNISAKSKLMLLNLADNSDRLGRVSFTIDSLADDCSITSLEAEKCIAELVQKKLIALKPSNEPLRNIDPWLEALLLINNRSEEVQNAI